MSLILLSKSLSFLFSLILNTILLSFILPNTKVFSSLISYICIPLSAKAFSISFPFILLLFISNDFISLLLTFFPLNLQELLINSFPWIWEIFSEILLILSWFKPEYIFFVSCSIILRSLILKLSSVFSFGFEGSVPYISLNFLCLAFLLIISISFSELNNKLVFASLQSKLLGNFSPSFSNFALLECFFSFNLTFICGSSFFLKLISVFIFSILFWLNIFDFSILTLFSIGVMLGLYTLLVLLLKDKESNLLLELSIFFLLKNSWFLFSKRKFDIVL